LKIRMMLDKLEAQWGEVNKKLPPSIKEARQTVDHIQVHYRYWSIVILFGLSSSSVCFLLFVLL